MSAFLCSMEHLSTIANAFGSNDNERGHVFDVLLRENVRSLETRYPHHLGEFSEHAANYARSEKTVYDLIVEAFKVSTSADLRKLVDDKSDLPLNICVTSTQVVMLCDCYDYQACENGDYSSTEAAIIVDMVRNNAMKKGGMKQGPLYDAMIWGI